MNSFEKWFLKRIFKKQVRQGFDHDKRIAELYAMIREASRNEFTEDNEITADDYLREWFESTQFRSDYGCREVLLKARRQLKDVANYITREYYKEPINRLGVACDCKHEIENIDQFLHGK